MSEKQKFIIVPGFSEIGSEHQSPYIDGSLPDGDASYSTVDFNRDYQRESMDDSWTRQIGEAVINAGDEPVVIVAHSLSTGPTLRALTELKKDKPDRELSAILDSPVGTGGKTPIPKLMYSATVKTFRNLIDSWREPYGSELGLEEGIDRNNRVRKVVRHMGVAGLQLAHAVSTLKEIWYASQYDINEDLQAAVEAGVGVHILLNNKDDMDNTNKPKRWSKKDGKRKAFFRRKQVLAVPKSLADDDGELLASVSTRSDGRASHDTQLYAPRYTDATYTKLTD